MFYGTRFFYRVLYFITAMTPAYIFFFLLIGSEHEKVFDIQIFNFKLNAVSFIFILIMFLLVCCIFLTFILRRQYFHPTTDEVLEPQINEFNDENLEERNGEVVAFLLGNILPVAITFEENLQLTMLVFWGLQIFIFILINKSTDIFPNVLLIIFGLNICRTETGKYVITFKSKKVRHLRVYQIGNPEKSKLYITAYREGN